MRYYIYENERAHLLAPFSSTHASFEVRCGAFRNIDRIAANIEQDDEICLLVREGIRDLVSERFPSYTVNPQELGPGCYIDGATLIESKDDSGSFFIDGSRLRYNDGKFNEPIASKGSMKLKSISYLWEALDHQPAMLSADIDIFDTSQTNKLDGVSLANAGSIYIDRSAVVSKGSVIDATSGPVIIDSDAFLDIGSLVKGPAYIGKGTIINPGTKVRGNFSTGTRCKIGGEVEDSVVHGFSNKQHEGYLGHSYVGEWVNIGAGTSTSDLKNNYSTIRYRVSDLVTEDTGRMFLGSMIGDYTSIGILTKLNSGTNIGPCSNIFGSGFQRKYIEPFSWGDSDRVDFDRLMVTIEKLKSRREQTLSDAEIKLLSDLYGNR